MNVSEMVREFHERFDIPIRETPTIPKPSERMLRFDLLNEEFQEYNTADLNEDLVEVADALGDMVYVIYGTALAFGIDLDAVLAEIHRSNMTKLGEDGRPVLREDYKILKGPNFQRPNIAKVLGL